jgi:hypothetical protein
MTSSIKSSRAPQVLTRMDLSQANCRVTPQFRLSVRANQGCTRTLQPNTFIYTNVKFDTEGSNMLINQLTSTFPLQQTLMKAVFASSVYY